MSYNSHNCKATLEDDFLSNIHIEMDYNIKVEYLNYMKYNNLIGEQTQEEKEQHVPLIKYENEEIVKSQLSTLSKNYLVVKKEDKQLNDTVNLSERVVINETSQNAIILTMYLCKERFDWYTMVTDKWLNSGVATIYILNSCVNSEELPERITKHRLFGGYILVPQKEKEEKRDLSRKALKAMECPWKKQRILLGPPTKFELDSLSGLIEMDIWKVISTHNLIFKLTGKYFSLKLAEYICNQREQFLYVQSKVSKFGQSCEVFGCPGHNFSVLISSMVNSSYKNLEKRLDMEVKRSNMNVKVMPTFHLGIGERVSRSDGTKLESL